MSTAPYPYLPRPLPAGLEGLVELALDVAWSWTHAAGELWRTIDAELWDATENPWLIIQSTSDRRLEELAASADFRAQIERELLRRRHAFEQRTWFGGLQTELRGLALRVAYFSMEFGVSEALPIYSGGLGILAGDHMKAASDLGVPLVGVGLLYQQGYFRQSLDAHGTQQAFYPYNDPVMLPVVPVRAATGEWVRVQLELPGRALVLRAWQANVGRLVLYLLDSNHPLNSARDRGITGQLYGSGQETRLQQELVLGLGGWRLLDALGHDPTVCHINEGHAAFAALERARLLMMRTGHSFAVALRATRAGNIFTTHTPVPAGFDRFPADLMQQYFASYANDLGISLSDLLALGRVDPGDVREPFNMAYLAVRASNHVSAVSRLHEEVSKQLFQPLFQRWPEREVPISHVTNGVHSSSWDSLAADALWTAKCGAERWRGDQSRVQAQLSAATDEELWTLRRDQRHRLVRYVQRRLEQQRSARGWRDSTGRTGTVALDPDALTMGFARRFASYKRPNLLLRAPERLTRLLTDRARPVQLLIAGKAHPDDDAGKRLIREWMDYIRSAPCGARAVFLEDYDMALAAEMVVGVDLWINTPRRPWEASGTSGMKVLVNGGLNISELDGWWAEAYSPEIGWAFGGTPQGDALTDVDAADAGDLYDLLEREVVPGFYDRGPGGIPTGWVNRIRRSMSELTPRFSGNRMVREYTERLYLPSAREYERRSAVGCAVAATLDGSCSHLRERWHMVRFGAVRVAERGGQYHFEVPVYLGGITPAEIRVELYSDAADDHDAARVLLVCGEALVGATSGYIYRGTVPASRPAGDYTARVIPGDTGLLVPLESPHILWSSQER